MKSSATITSSPSASRSGSRNIAIARGKNQKQPSRLDIQWIAAHAGKNSPQATRLRSAKATANVAEARAQNDRASPVDRREARQQWKTSRHASTTSIKSDTRGPGAVVPRVNTTPACAANKEAASMTVVRALANLDIFKTLIRCEVSSMRSVISPVPRTPLTEYLLARRS